MGRSSGFSVFGSRIGATLKHLERLGLPAAELLSGTGLSTAQVCTAGDNQEVVDACALLRLYELALQLSDTPDLGLRYGEGAGVTEYRPIGYAMLSAATDLEAVNLAITYQRLYYGTMARMSLHHEHGRGVVRISEELPNGSCRRFFLEMLLSGFLRFNHTLVGRRTQLTELRLALAEPEYSDRYGALFDCPVVFDSPRHELIFDTGVLAQPLPNSDAITARACEQVCREQLISFDRGEPTAIRVRRLLCAAPGPGPAMAEVAGQLNCHERTLHRRLRAESTSFQVLKDDVLRERAEACIRNSALSVNDIALQLGFDSPSNFRRAFRKWTGQSPQEWRRQAAG